MHIRMETYVTCWAEELLVLNSSSALCSRGVDFRGKDSGHEGLRWGCKEKLLLKQPRKVQQKLWETTVGRNMPELFFKMRRKKNRSFVLTLQSPFWFRVLTDLGQLKKKGGGGRTQIFLSSFEKSSAPCHLRGVFWGARSECFCSCWMLFRLEVYYMFPKLSIRCPL